MKRGSSITTGAGDQGTTRLLSGEEVSKASPRVDAYGDLDELNCVLGLARLHATRPEVRERVLGLQRELFVVGAELATESAHLDLLSRRVDERMVEEMDRQCREVEGRIRMPGGFVIPGGTLAGGFLDCARSIARRCERRAVRLSEEGHIANRAVLIWLNRLSDFLWLLARLEEDEAVLPKDG